MARDYGVCVRCGRYGSACTCDPTPPGATRTVKAGHGHFLAMRYQFRARIEKRRRKTWFGFGSWVTEYRAVIERRHITWTDHEWIYWRSIKEDAVTDANEYLDDIERAPSGEYVSTDSSN